MSEPRPILLAKATEQFAGTGTEPIWVIPRSVDAYKLLFSQAAKACRDNGMTPMDSFLIAACVLTSIGIHVPGAMEKAP